MSKKPFVTKEQVEEIVKMMRKESVRMQRH